MTIADQARLSFPFGGAAGTEPPPEFAKLREEAPVTRVVLPTGDEAWLVTRYADVRAVLSDARFSRAAAEAPGAPRMSATSPGPHTILGMDPPDHTRLRKLVVKSFTTRRIDELRPQIEKITYQLLGAISVAPRPVDLIPTFTLALPLKVIFELLGVDYEDRDYLHTLTDVIFSLGGYSAEEVADARGKLTDYMAGMIESRRQKPTDDLVSGLVAARDLDDKLSETELIDFVLILLTVGHMSTANTLTSAIFTLLRHPDQMARLRQQPDLMPAAVEELLRYNPFALTGTQLRVAVEDVQVADVMIRKGEAVVTSLASANHDPEVFEDPGTLDVGRNPNPHLAFGYGVHHCLGSQLARMEMQIGLGALLRKLPDTLQLAVPEEWLTWKLGLTARSLTALPVNW